MPELGKYFNIIVGAYGSTFLILTLLVFFTIFNFIKTKKRLSLISKERMKIDN